MPNYNIMGPAKAALEATSRQLAHELGPEGIRVNCLSPGPMNTVSARGIPGISVCTASFFVCIWLSTHCLYAMVCAYSVRAANAQVLGRALAAAPQRHGKRRGQLGSVPGERHGVGDHRTDYLWYVLAFQYPTWNHIRHV